MSATSLEMSIIIIIIIIIIISNLYSAYYKKNIGATIKKLTIKNYYKT